MLEPAAVGDTLSQPDGCRRSLWGSLWDTGIGMVEKGSAMNPTQFQ